VSYDPAERGRSILVVLAGLAAALFILIWGHLP
jgi:hypothetical protein